MVDFLEGASKLAHFVHMLINVACAEALGGGGDAYQFLYCLGGQ
jgi:hypothetical protein